MAFRGLDVLVITLKPDFDLSELRRIFPGADVNVQPGVDLRKVSTLSLARAGLVSPTGYTTLQQGRKWHFELNSRGGVGLAHANRLAMEQSDRPLLLLEDDFRIVDTRSTVADCKALLQHLDEFDMAVFGARFRGDSRSGLSPASFLSNDWRFAKGHFFLTHCVIYSPRGRQRVREHLRAQPLDMQIDSLFGFLAEISHTRLLLQVKNHTVVQSVHVSHIQNDTCAWCDVSPTFTYRNVVPCVVLLVIGTHIALWSQRYRVPGH